LASIDKAIALAQALQRSAPNDSAVLQALARAQGARGDILSETSDIPGAVASLRAEVATWDRLIAMPGVTPALYLADCAATSALGDVLGQDTGLGDVRAALVAYRRCLDLDRRALALDPASIPAQRGLASMQMKVGNAELDLDPNPALQDFQLALQELSALPAAQQEVFSTKRLRAITLRKVAVAYTELGDYTQALPPMEQAMGIDQQLAAADPKDMRSMGDLYRAYSDEESIYEFAANPTLGGHAADRRQNLQQAEACMQQALIWTDKMLRKMPADLDRQAERSQLQAQIVAMREILREPGNTDSLERQALDTLRIDATRDEASPHVLTLAFTAWLEAEPDSLRNPAFARNLAERLVARTRRKAPEGLLALAEALRAAGEPSRSRDAAREGLALLPEPAKNAPIPRVRKLLLLEAADQTDSKQIPQGLRVF
jgi:tetratricopeptide (TPR) repeat protein